MKFAYAISTWNGARLVETISSIPKRSRLMVIDNSLYGWQLSKSWNYAIKRLCIDEGFDAVIVMNDDVVLRPTTGEELASALLEKQFTMGYDRELLLISARHANHGDMFTDEVNWKLLNEKKPEFQPGPDFSCFCVSKKLFENIGTFDENFNPAYYEDNDMHRRIQLAGFEAYAYAPYWHYRSMTVRTSEERRGMLGAAQAKCRDYYIAKWGGNVGEERYITAFNKGFVRV